MLSELFVSMQNLKRENVLYVVSTIEFSFYDSVSATKWCNHHKIHFYIASQLINKPTTTTISAKNCERSVHSYELKRKQMFCIEKAYNDWINMYICIRINVYTSNMDMCSAIVVNNSENFGKPMTISLFNAVRHANAYLCHMRKRIQRVSVCECGAPTTAIERCWYAFELISK